LASSEKIFFRLLEFLPHHAVSLHICQQPKTFSRDIRGEVLEELYSLNQQVSELPGNLLEMQILRTHPRPTKSVTVEWVLAVCVFTALQGFCCSIKFKIFCSSDNNLMQKCNNLAQWPQLFPGPLLSGFHWFFLILCLLF
jgi:hypothetical protein